MTHLRDSQLPTGHVNLPHCALPFMNLQPTERQAKHHASRLCEQHWSNTCYKNELTHASLSTMQLFLGGRGTNLVSHKLKLYDKKPHHTSSPKSDAQDCSHLLMYHRGGIEQARTSWQHSTAEAVLWINEGRSNHKLTLPVTGQTFMMVPKIWQVHNLRRILRDTHLHSQPASLATVLELAQDMSNTQRSMMMKVLHHYIR